MYICQTVVCIYVDTILYKFIQINFYIPNFISAAPIMVRLV